MIGKGAMIWQLREWQDGDPARQVAQALDLRLSHVSIKIIDGTNERYEPWWVKRQNYELLPETIPALRDAGIGVKGWGWTYGSYPKIEAEKTIELCRIHGIDEFDIDAEHQYNVPGMAGTAEIYSCTLAGAVPEIRVGLCSYRFPKTYQPDFPVDAFAPFMDYWVPQVYFLGDCRLTGGASQLEISSKQYDGIRRLPFIGVAPTYPYGDWRATKDQLLLFFEKAKDLGHEGFMIWDLPQASQEQIEAVREFEWDPQPAMDWATDVRASAAAIRGQADLLDNIANTGR